MAVAGMTILWYFSIAVRMSLWFCVTGSVVAQKSSMTLALVSWRFERLMKTANSTISPASAVVVIVASIFHMVSLDPASAISSVAGSLATENKSNRVSALAAAVTVI